MINIKNFMIIIFSILLSINVASGLTIYKDNKTYIKTHLIINEQQNILYNFKNHDIKHSHYNNLLNFIIFSVHRNSHGYSYFTVGCNLRNINFKLNKPIYIFDHINPMFIGIKINRVGKFECGKNYNLIYHVNRFTHKKFNNTCDIKSLHISHDLTYHVKNSITYYNKNFFGFIDRLTIASQYQYLNFSLPVDWYHDKLNHFIEYDFKKHKGSIAAAYSLNMNSYFQNEYFNYLKDKTKSYAIAFKYIFKKLYFAVSYSMQENLLKNTVKKMYFDYAQELELLSEYHFNRHVTASINLLRMYYMNHVYQNKLLVLNKDDDLSKKEKSYSIFNTCNTAVKYCYNKNIILYLKNNFEIVNTNTVYLLTVKNVLEGGMTLKF